MWDAHIGSLDWEACETCVHGNKDSGGCDTYGPDLYVDGDWISCSCYSEGEWRSKEEIEQERLAEERRQEVEAAQVRLPLSQEAG